MGVEDGVGEVMPAQLGKCSPIFCLSSRPSVSELRRVQVWPTGLMRCGVSPGESRSSLKLRSSARLCCSVMPHTHTRAHTHRTPPTHTPLLYISISIICKFNFFCAVVISLISSLISPSPHLHTHTPPGGTPSLSTAGPT